MTTIRVTASKTYDVKIGSGLLAALGAEAEALVSGRSCCLVSDDTVFALYGETAEKSLEQAGFTVCSFVFPHGEQSKSFDTYCSLMRHLARAGLTRSDLLVALGGGVTGDLTGFAAATYLRGIACIQVPTSLLAMVDSSVGGKTAIDLPEGKNLCGAFYQPHLVLCDLDTLKTLPEEIYTDGCAEVIKYGVLGSRELFDMLPGQYDPEAVVAQCVAMKRDIVQEDEFDGGRRQLLNLGHTFGHAIEKNSDFTLSHGKCVAIGMAMVARAARCRDTEAIVNILEHFGLPTKTAQSADEIFAAALGDKKRRGHGLTLVVPEAIGRCRLQQIPVEELKHWIEVGL